MEKTLDGVGNLRREKRVPAVWFWTSYKFEMSTQHPCEISTHRYICIYGRMWAGDRHLGVIRLSIIFKAMSLDELTQRVSVGRSPGTKPWKTPVFRSWRVCGHQWHRLRIGNQREKAEEPKRCGVLKANWEKCFRKERVISCVRCCWWIK